MTSQLVSSSSSFVGVETKEGACHPFYSFPYMVISKWHSPNYLLREAFLNASRNNWQLNWELRQIFQEELSLQEELDCYANRRSVQFDEVYNLVEGLDSEEIDMLMDTFQSLRSFNKRGYHNDGEDRIFSINKFIRNVFRRCELDYFRNYEVNDLMSFLEAIFETRERQEMELQIEEERLSLRGQDWERQCEEQDECYKEQFEIELLPYLAVQPPSNPQLNVGSWIEEYYE